MFAKVRTTQERDGSNTPTVSYTRGTDLSGSLEGAGGIGGLLARSSGYSSGNWTTNNFYFADGNGNITYMLNGSQAMAASYRYDPFGNTISSSGSLATNNVYRFSSKEIHTNSAMYYYGYRFYDPSMQRWINRDPIQDLGFLTLTSRLAVRGAPDRNAFVFVRNKVPNTLDALGLTLYYCTVPTSKLPPTFGIGRHGYLWNDTTGDECGQESSCGSGPTDSNNGGPGPKDTNPDRKGRVCTPIEGSDDDKANDELMSWCHAHANDGGWLPPFHDCHTVVNKCLSHGGLGGVDPGRFGPQPTFSPIPGLTGIR